MSYLSKARQDTFRKALKTASNVHDSNHSLSIHHDALGNGFEAEMSIKNTALLSHYGMENYSVSCSWASREA